jgi:hypothetical protein
MYQPNRMMVVSVVGKGMASRIAKGFHRIGIVLAIPCFLAALWAGSTEWSSPSGAIKPRPLPEGALAWKATNPDDPDVRNIIARQKAAGFTAPPAFALIGYSKGSKQKDEQDGIGQKPSAWTTLELWDGRQIEISTADSGVVVDLAGAFLQLIETEGTGLGRKYEIQYPDKGMFLINVIKGEPQANLTAGLPRSPDWTFPLLIAAAGIALYAIARGIGWIIDGFVR